MIVVNARFLTQKITGVQRYALEICKRLPAKIGNHKIVFVLPKTTLINKLDKDVDIRFIGKFQGQIWEQVSLPVFLMKNKNPLLINFVGIAPIFYKNKIMFLYDLAFKHHPEWFSYSFQKLYNLLIPMSIRNTRKIITDSNYVKQDIVNTFDIAQNKMEVIYAAPSEKFINKNLHREKIILTVSSIDPRKNLTRVIKAFNELDSEYKLVVVGQKNKTFSKVGIDNLDTGDNVIFTGYLTDKELIDLYNRAELFIYASLFEGFGIPPLEAQACGCACIISNSTSLPEIYKNSVEYFDPNSIDSIKVKLEGVLNDKNKRKKLQKKSGRNSMRYKWEVSTGKMILLIEEII